MITPRTEPDHDKDSQVQKVCKNVLPLQIKVVIKMCHCNTHMYNSNHFAHNPLLHISAWIMLVGVEFTGNTKKGYK